MFLKVNYVIIISASSGGGGNSSSSGGGGGSISRLFLYYFTQIVHHKLILLKYNVQEKRRFGDSPKHRVLGTYCFDHILEKVSLQVP